jgi:hypothetical protein
MRMRRLMLLPVLLITIALPAAEPAAYALIVAGDGVEAQFTENYRDWSIRLHKVLTDAGIPAGNIRLLMEKKELAPQICADVSTRENVLKAANDLIAKVKAGDQLSIFLIGHGSEQGGIGKLCVPGTDLTSDDVAELLNKVPTREVLFVNTAAFSSSFVEKSSAPGRIVITATNSTAQGNETYFAEFLLRGLETPAADADKNGAINALEAFNYAADQCPKWYLRQSYDGDNKSWRINGKQSRVLWEKFYGKVAEKKMTPAENPDADDTDPQLGEWGRHWANRRMPTENAQLDDNGDRVGTAIFLTTECIPLTGVDELADGFTARTFVLGKPKGNAAAPVQVAKPETK